MQALDNACRSCMVHKCGLISMESLIDRTVKIVDCFQIHLSVNIAKHVDLSYEICVECLDKLLKARELHLNVIKSEKYFQKRLSESVDKSSKEGHSPTVPGNSCDEDNGASSTEVFNENSTHAGPAKTVTSETNFEAFEDGRLVESIKTEMLDDEFLNDDDSSSEDDEADVEVNPAGNESSAFPDANTATHGQSTSDQHHPNHSPNPQSESSSSHGQKAKRKRQCRGTYSSYKREQKELFITLYQNGQSIKEAALSANINNSTARGILRSYAKNQCNIVEQSRGGCRQKKLTDEVLEKIKECVECNSRITLKEIRQKLIDQNINIGKSSINIGLRKLQLNLRPPSFRSIFSKIKAMKQEQNGLVNGTHSLNDFKFA